jgi:hypothetical protein
MGGREELSRSETGENGKSSSDFHRGEFALSPQGMDAPCYPDVMTFVYEEFQIDEVKKVEKR